MNILFYIETTIPPSFYAAPTVRVSMTFYNLILIDNIVIDLKY